LRQLDRINEEALYQVTTFRGGLSLMEFNLAREQSWQV